MKRMCKTVLVQTVGDPLRETRRQCDSLTSAVKK